MLKIFSNLIKDKKVDRYREMAGFIDTFEETTHSLSDEGLREKTRELQKRLKEGEAID